MFHESFRLCLFLFYRTITIHTQFAREMSGPMGVCGGILVFLIMLVATLTGPIWGFVVLVKNLSERCKKRETQLKKQNKPKATSSLKPNKLNG